MSPRPNPGEIWTNTASKQYRIITLANDINTGDDMIVFEETFGEERILVQYYWDWRKEFNRVED